MYIIADGWGMCVAYHHHYRGQLYTRHTKEKEQGLTKRDLVKSNQERPEEQRTDS